jgi:hypothetical protein
MPRNTVSERCKPRDLLLLTLRRPINMIVLCDTSIYENGWLSTVYTSGDIELENQSTVEAPRSDNG